MIAIDSDTSFTPEQRQAIDRREGDLFLDAGAGSGKTAVLVERFAQAVVQDGIRPEAILTITFTDKAAAEMRGRIRDRLLELGARDAARATEEAFISTIHGFCARVLRAHALAAGIDPSFTVLDELEAGRLADSAFDRALVDLAASDPGAIELISAYGPSDLRVTVQAVHGELRSRGQRHPRLPALPPAPSLDGLGRALREMAAAAAAELGASTDPSPRVAQALERLERVGAVLGAAEPWPGDLDTLRLPGGNGAALTTDVCLAYAESLERFRAGCAQRWASRVHPLLDRLLTTFGERYEKLKREASGLDFEDLELLCRDLLRDEEELRDRYRERFERVMVDELQDTNGVQLELIEMVSANNLFTVGDAQQSIYGFRHADVELFERRGERLERVGARATLQTNFRAVPDILAVVNRVFAGARFTPLVPGRLDPDPGAEPAIGAGGAPEGARVELLVIDKGAEWAADGLSAPWRIAEANALAERIQQLVAAGSAPRDVVVLTRATTDLRAYERALEQRGVPTYLIGGRGYWSHPQVVDLVGYLKLLANPRDEEALYTVLASPLVGASVDALVLLAAAVRQTGRHPWWVLCDPEGHLDELSDDDRERLLSFSAVVASERALAPRKGIEELIERALELTGYDLAVLAMPGGQRRLANVRKLMRLGREHGAANGPDLRGFLDLVRRRSESWRPDPDQSEAPVESEALDAVRLMTIHRAKGLEFEIVCVADLGRGPRWSSEVVRVGRDDRLGLRLARPGTGRREPALFYEELGDEQRARAAAEERRVFYVAMTRARQRLILSGAVKLDSWGAAGGGAPIGWLGPLLVPDVGLGEGVSEGVRFRVVRPGSEADRARRCQLFPRGGNERHQVAEPSPWLPQTARTSAPTVTTLSYTSLAAYHRCGYRFYVERVLGVPGTREGGGSSELPEAVTTGAVLTAAERGTAVHALLERIDFRRPVMPTAAMVVAASPKRPSEAELEEMAALVARFATTRLFRRLGAATQVRREQRFGFLLGDALITGMFDVIANEPGGTLIVDYKTDRLDRGTGVPLDPAAVVAAEYATQQLVYALAGLRAGAEQVEIVHVFLDAPDAPVTASFARAQDSELQARLAALAAGVLERRSFEVSELPHRALCDGCPAEGGLCSWPLEMTRREAPDRLF